MTADFHPNGPKNREKCCARTSAGSIKFPALRTFLLCRQAGSCNHWLIDLFGLARLGAYDTGRLPIGPMRSFEGECTMLRTLTSFLFVGGVFGLAACANLNTIDRTTELSASDGRGKAVHLDIQQRLLIVNELGHVCSEPSPDALAAYAAALSIGASSSAKGAVSGAAGQQSSAASVGLRTQSITLMRDALFRMCEAFANGAVGPGQIASLLGRSQDLTAAVLAVEQLTGAVVAQQAALTGTTSSDASATAVSGTELLEIAIADEERKQERFEKAERDLAAAKIEHEAAKTEHENAKTARDAALADENATPTQKQDAEDEVALRLQDRQRAQGAVELAQAVRDSRNQALIAAQDYRSEVEANPDAAASAANAATTTAAQFSAAAQRNVLNKDATEAIAASVEAIVKTVLAKEYTEDACMAMITYLPRDFDKWTADQKANLKRVQDICFKLIATGINKRITTLFGADETSDRIDTWVKVAGNRQRLQNWLDTQTPKLNVFALLQGSYRDLRERAIAKFNIP
jgi:hypothetical protein